MIRLFVEEPFGEGPVTITGDAAQHARVRRVGSGEALQILDGKGGVGTGIVEALNRTSVQARIERVTRVPPPTPLEVLVPVADRDRMLFAAEKCVELQVTAWRPVVFARSRSVTPRGEGPKFQEKVLARMRGALEQCGGTWLPTISEEIEGSAALSTRKPAFSHVLLAEGAPPMHADAFTSPTVVAVGPEGGLEPAERALAADHGWTFRGLTDTTLRFETALVAAIARIRTDQYKILSSA